MLRLAPLTKYKLLPLLPTSPELLSLYRSLQPLKLILFILVLLPISWLLLIWSLAHTLLIALPQILSLILPLSLCPEVMPEFMVSQDSSSIMFPILLASLLDGMASPSLMNLPQIQIKFNICLTLISSLSILSARIALDTLLPSIIVVVLLVPKEHLLPLIILVEIVEKGKFGMVHNVLFHAQPASISTQPKIFANVLPLLTGTDNLVFPVHQAKFLFLKLSAANALHHSDGMALLVLKSETAKTENNGALIAIVASALKLPSGMELTAKIL